MTPSLIQILARELREMLLSSRLSHASQSSEDVVDLSFYHPERPTRHLTVALLPLRPLLFASSEKRPSLPTPPNFCRSLRKHLDYAQLCDVRAEPGERLVHFILRKPEGLFDLVFEGLPKYPNLILAGPDGNIISALRYKNEVERPVLPQAPYAPPPHRSSQQKNNNGHGTGPASTSGAQNEAGGPQPGPSPEKPNLWNLGADELEGLWNGAGRPPLAAWLKEGFRGSDPELAAYLESFGDQAFREWERTRTEIADGPWEHFVLHPGPPPLLKVFPLHSPAPAGTRTFASAGSALEALFLLENRNREVRAARSRLESEIKRALKHEKRILEKLGKDRTEAERSDQYQWWGELLMAQLHKVKLHASEVSLEDVVRGAPAPVRIPLDPEDTPLVNAQRFFRKAQKGSRGLALVEKREAEVKGRLEALKSAQRSLPALKSAEEMEKAFEGLFPRRKEPAPAPRKPREEKVPTPNILRSKWGREFEICAGTSAAANEYVTFQLAQPGDLWFHARDLPGAHVILRRLRRNADPPGEAIYEAARLAAARSKAPAGSKVMVSYTEKKNVRKIPGAPMGMVSMTKEKSLVVEVGLEPDRSG